MTILNNYFVKFLLVGVLNTVFGYSIFSMLIYLNIHYTVAVFLSTVLGALFNFKTIGKLVFKSHDNRLIFRFVFVYLIVYLLNISSLWFFKSLGYTNMYVNGLILVIPLALVSFVLNKKFVFKG